MNWINTEERRKNILDGISRDKTWQPPASYGGECLHVYFNRLQRDGWTLRPDLTPDDLRAVFEKPVGSGWILHKYCHADLNHPEGKSVYFDRHALVRDDSTETIDCPEWEWADLDGNRLVWTTGGRLHAAHLKASGLVKEETLHDFNDMTFSAITAPY
ncbi:MAG: hypothetical protein WC661_14240 [Opitutaceae bacterium]